MSKTPSECVPRFSLTISQLSGQQFKLLYFCFILLCLSWTRLTIVASLQQTSRSRNILHSSRREQLAAARGSSRSHSKIHWKGILLAIFTNVLMSRLILDHLRFPERKKNTSKRALSINFSRFSRKLIVQPWNLRYGLCKHHFPNFHNRSRAFDSIFVILKVAIGQHRGISG